MVGSKGNKHCPNSTREAFTGWSRRFPLSCLHAPALPLSTEPLDACWLTQFPPSAVPSSSGRWSCWSLCLDCPFQYLLVAHSLQLNVFTPVLPPLGGLPSSSLAALLPVSFISSMASGHSVVSDSLEPNGLLHARFPCPSPSPRVCSNSCPLSQWCHPTISSSVAPFSCPQSYPASRSFPMNWLLAWGGQSIGASVSTSALPMNIQDWFPLWLTGFISLKSKELSRVFSSTTIRKHQFLGTQPSL